MEQRILPSQGDVKHADAIEMAIGREIKAKYMYQTIAKYSQEPRLKVKMSFLTEEEQNHRDNLEDLYKKITGAVKNFDESVSLPDESKFKEYAGMPIDELLKLAVEKEVEAHDFYKELANNSENVGMKDLFNYLAEEEMTHRRLLEIEYKLYQGATPLARSVETIPGVYKDWW